MALRDPVAVYDAANNVEAQLVKMFLVESGVEAFALEDVSLVGYWMFGILPEIHKPQVFVNKADVERALRLLEEYESQAAERERLSRAVDAGKALPIEVACEECSESTSFPSSQRGSVQMCPRCGAYVDVGGVDEADAFWLEHEGTDEA
jgi:Putative prokaryotic signal transducing protein